MRARAARLRLVTWLAVCSWIEPVSAGAATPRQAFVTVAASDLGGSTYASPIGGFTFMEHPASFHPFLVTPPPQ